MARGILGVVAGLVAWTLTATVVGLIMRAAWPHYASVAAAMAFTLPMLFARLAIGALATLVAGWLTSVIARRSTLARLATGLVLLVGFIPVHIKLLDKFPIWYHLTFLLSLVPLAYLGGNISARWWARGRVGASAA
jgi:hypothetical protein